MKRAGMIGLGVLALAVAFAACTTEEETNGDPPKQTTTTTTTSQGGSGGTTTTTTTTSEGGTGGSVIECSQPHTDILGECDLLNQDCPPGEWCNVTGQAPPQTVCVLGGGGTLGKGDECTTDSQCQDGLRCVDNHCTPACCPADDVPCEGGNCDIHVNYGDEGYVMMCSYALACVLLTDDCPENMDCHIADQQQGLAVCDDPSGAFVEEGGDCFYRNDCGESQLCHEEVCRDHCHMDNWQNEEVGLGGCLPERGCAPLNLANFPNIGICIPSCTLMEADTCPPGEVCHMKSPSLPLGECQVPTDPVAGEGESCNLTIDCGDSMYCQSHTCRYHCDVDNWQSEQPGLGGCPGGQSCLNMNYPKWPGLGICAP